MPDPYPFRLVKAPVPKTLRPPWLEILIGWASCLFILLLCSLAMIGLLVMLGILAWQVWP